MRKILICLAAARTAAAVATPAAADRGRYDNMATGGCYVSRVVELQAKINRLDKRESFRDGKHGVFAERLPLCERWSGSNPTTGRTMPSGSRSIFECAARAGNPARISGRRPSLGRPPGRPVSHSSGGSGRRQLSTDSNDRVATYRVRRLRAPVARRLFLFWGGNATAVYDVELLATAFSLFSRQMTTTRSTCKESRNA